MISSGLDKEKIKVIALGGSLVNPGRPNILFLKKIKRVIIDLIQKNNYRFLIVIGGGKLCRLFQKSLKKLLTTVSNEDLDQLGIEVTRLNAYFVAKVFADLAQQGILKSFSQKIKFDKKIIFGAGVKPGCSTDYDAFYWAKKIGVNEIYLPTNVKYIFDKDPKKFKSAKAFRKITWSNYLKLISDKWAPGSNVPIDQKAARFAKKQKMIAYVYDGTNLTNFKRALQKQKFVGTIVTP